MYDAVFGSSVSSPRSRGVWDSGHKSAASELTALLKLWNLSTAPELADHAVVNGTKEGLTLPSGSNRVPAAYSETLLKETPTVSASTVLRIGLGSGASSRLPMTGDGLFDKCRGGEMQIASIQS